MKRETELDILRFLALLAVVIIHVSVASCNVLDVNNTNWKIATAWVSMVTWSIPVFLMISGGFLLDPKHEVTLEKLYLVR